MATYNLKQLWEKACKFDGITPEKTRYTVNHRIMVDYRDALQYWEVHGGILMEKIDGLPAHVLLDKPLSH